MPADPVVVNINVPNVELAEIRGWQHGRVGHEPPRKMSSALLEPKEGHDGSFHVRMSWGDAVELPADTDGGLVERDIVSVTYLSRLAAETRDDMGAGEAQLARLLS